MPWISQLTPVPVPTVPKNPVGTATLKSSVLPVSEYTLKVTSFPEQIPSPMIFNPIISPCCLAFVNMFDSSICQ